MHTRAHTYNIYIYMYKSVSNAILLITYLYFSHCYRRNVTECFNE